MLSTLTKRYYVKLATLSMYLCESMLFVIGDAFHKKNYE